MSYQGYWKTSINMYKSWYLWWYLRKMKDAPSDGDVKKVINSIKFGVSPSFLTIDVGSCVFIALVCLRENLRQKLFFHQMYTDYRGLVGFLVGMFPSDSKPNQLRAKLLFSTCEAPRHAGNFRRGWDDGSWGSWSQCRTLHIEQVIMHHLVGALEHGFYDFPYIGNVISCHHPNWRTPSFFRGVGIPPTSHGFCLWVPEPQEKVMVVFSRQPRVFFTGWPLADPNASRRAAACRTYASCVLVFMVISCIKKRTTGSCYWSLWCIHI